MKTPLPASRYWCFGLLSVGGLSADLFSKWWVFRSLGGPNRGSDWAWNSNFLWGRFDCTLTTTFNFGALFGLGQGLSWLFALLSVGAVVGIVYWLFARGNAQSRWLTVTLALVLAGALGNLYDRMGLHGWKDSRGQTVCAVRDFINCTIPGIEFQGFRPRLIPDYHWPIFNVADILLVTGAVMLTLYSFFSPKPEAASKELPSSSTSSGKGDRPLASQTGAAA